ncbi:MAG: ClpXP protease specificity-enhancing factor SspB [Pseudomonadota bacterium]
MQDQIGYDEIIEDSMRTVIYRVLKKVEKNGLTGGHHFIITFSTRNPAVVLSETLRKRFPSEMTIVIQHQFSSFLVAENYFKVSLSFAGVLENLTIPYKAISSFADPEVNFGLKFNAIDIEDYEEDEEPQNQAQKSSEIDLSSKVVSLDDFRKNRDKKN